MMLTLTFSRRQMRKRQTRKLISALLAQGYTLTLAKGGR
jgi:uncharacterized protein YcgL (UPF0745 family)